MSPDYSASKAIFCALQCEATPIIQALKLKKCNDLGFFPTFQNQHWILIVTGLGGTDAVAAVNFTMGRFPGVSEVWNIGICGARGGFTIGSLALPTKIIIHELNSTFYPEPMIGGDISKGTLGTFLWPVRSALSDIDFYDMEGGYIFREMSRYLPPSRINLIKVISDNLSELPANKDQISSLIDSQTEGIIDLMNLQSDSFFQKTHSLTPPENTFLSQLSIAMRLTLSQQRQLVAAAQDHKARGGDINQISEIASPHKRESRERDKWFYETIQILQRI